MPERKPKEIVKVQNGTLTIRIFVGDKNHPDGGTFAEYDLIGKGVIGAEEADPKGSVEVFRKWAATADEETLTDVWERYTYGTDLKCRAKNKIAIAQESTFVVRAGQKVDLMTLPVPALCRVVNAAYVNVEFIPADATPERREKLLADLVPAPFRVARRRLLEQGKAKEVDGALRVTK